MNVLIAVIFGRTLVGSLWPIPLENPSRFLMDSKKIGEVSKTLGSMEKDFYSFYQL